MIKNKTITLSSLILAFIAITLLAMNNNIFVNSLDNTVHAWIASHQNISFYNLMLSITNICDVYGTIIIYLVFGLFLVLKDKKSFYIFTIATSSGVILTQVVKHLVQRVRPYNILEQGPGFPSAHATIAVIFLISSIVLLAPIIKNRFSKNVFILVASVIFTLVAFSRIYLAVHWTSDVVAGIILGSICFIFAQIAYCYKKENVL